MFYREGDSVAGRQCVRTSRSLGNVYNLDLCTDECRVGLPRSIPEKAGSFMVASPRSAKILEEKFNVPQTFQLKRKLESQKQFGENKK